MLSRQHAEQRSGRQTLDVSRRRKRAQQEGCVSNRASELEGRGAEQPIAIPNHPLAWSYDQNDLSLRGETSPGVSARIVHEFSMSLEPACARPTE